MAIKLLIGGSPCTHWSIAKRNGRETTAEGEGWELFKNYLIAKEKFQPDYFLYENNKSAAQEIKNQISKELRVDLMHINSALVSAQNRERFYAFNWKIEPPQDRGLVVDDILEEDDNELNYFISKQNKPVRVGDIGSTAQAHRVYSVHGKSVTLNAGGGGQGGKTGLYLIPAYIRKLTPIECERLQTLPDNYTAGVSDAQRYKAIGNGWTADVIIHILQGALQGIPKDEEIIVLSIYDGIGTGRYCLDKMGFTNIKYYAYEIDKYAMQIANKNYPDIIQCGNAFQVREENWQVKKPLKTK